MRIITVEEHFHHPEVTTRAGELAGLPAAMPIDAIADVITAFSVDPDTAAQLGGERLKHMDEVGIDVQVVSHGNGGPGALVHPEAVDLCRRVNDDLATQVDQYPDRFKAFATLPLHDPAAAGDELRRCVGDLGFVGALIAGTHGGLFLDHEKFEPVLAAAESVDVPLYIHPGLPEAPVVESYYTGNWPGAVQFMLSGPGFGWHAEAGVHLLRLILSGTLDRHPSLKLITGHWGEFVTFYLDRVDEMIALVPHRLEQRPSDYFRDRIWVTPSGMYSTSQLDFITRELGPDRIIYSEDFPYVVRDDVTTFLENAGLSDDDTHAIAHGNAEALLRI